MIRKIWYINTAKPAIIHALLRNTFFSSLSSVLFLSSIGANIRMIYNRKFRNCKWISLQLQKRISKKVEKSNPKWKKEAGNDGWTADNIRMQLKVSVEKQRLKAIIYFIIYHLIFYWHLHPRQQKKFQMQLFL